MSGPAWQLPRALLAALLLLAPAAPAVGAGCAVACDGAIWLASVATFEGSAWQAQGRTRRREIALQLRVERVLKGPPVDSLVATRAQQNESAGSRIAAVPGVWSGLDLAPGTSWVVFLRRPLPAGARTLDQHDIREVLPAQQAAADATLVVDAARQRLTLPKMITLLAQKSPNYGQVLGDDLLARAEATLPGDRAAFAALARLLEQPALPPAFRRQVYGGLVDTLARRDFLPAGFAADLALTGFRLLMAPDPGPLAAPLRQTWLPALLGIAGATSRLAPGAVFATAPVDHARALAAPALGDELRAWLTQPAPASVGTIR